MSRARGRHAGLTRQDILRAAVRLADRDGLAALSMRRLGAELGVEAMALYHHVPNKEALLDGMVEEVAAEVPVPRFTAAGWRNGMRRYALALLDAVAAHPELVPLALYRPAVTPRNLQTMEDLLRGLHSAGFEPRQALDLVYALNGLVLVHAALRTGTGDAEPAARGEPGQTTRLADLPTETYPLLAEAARGSARRGPTARFKAAVDALLTGFAAALPEPPAP
ncbi:MAG TPA: TetR/AcrR family transcriptional regulator C-terminal domain-containing protein [Streptosporangiales bacterium]